VGYRWALHVVSPILCVIYNQTRNSIVWWLYIHCSLGYYYLHLFCTYIFLQYIALYCCCCRFTLFIDRPVAKNGVQETYNNIMARRNEGFHRFRVRLDHPCSLERFPCVYTIHYTATPSSCRGDRPRRLRRRVYEYACAVTMVAVHAAAAAPGFGYNFENRSKR